MSADSKPEPDYRSTTSIDLHTPPPMKGSPPPPPPQSHKKPTLRQQFPGKRTWANVRLGLRLLCLLCSLATGTAMAMVIVTWQKSKNENERFWPKDPQMVPTYYMLAAAGVSLPIHIALIITHFTSRERYLTEAYTSRDRISTIIQLWLGLTWLVGGVLTRVYLKNKYSDNADLWSWSCGVSWHPSIGRDNGAWVGVDGWMWKWTTVCAWLRGGYTIAYVNAFLEYLSVLTYSINGYMARRKGYKPAPMNDA